MENELLELMSFWLLLQRRMDAAIAGGKDVPEQYIYLSELIIAKIITRLGGREDIIELLIEQLHTQMLSYMKTPHAEEKLNEKLAELKNRCYPPIKVPNSFKEMMAEFKKDPAAKDPDPHISDSDKKINEYLKQKKASRRKRG